MPAPRMTTSPAQPAPIDHIRLWFDPTCPWAWLTYLWLRQTQRSGRDFTLDLAVMSLAILNENNPDAPHRYKYPQAQSLQLGRVLVAATQAAENRTSTDVLGSMYDSLGAYVHHEGGRDYDLANREALAAANLPTHLAELATATTYDQVLRANTTAAFAIVGPGVGTPVIELNQTTAYFGPILSHPTTPEEAVRIFDAITTLATVPHFYELKRHRAEEPTFET